jgi:hypothetical protein
MQDAVPNGGAMSALMPIDTQTARAVCEQAEKETGKVCEVASKDIERSVRRSII